MPIPCEFEFVVREEDGESRHNVTMSHATCERPSRGKQEPERCIEAAFRFLLDREPKELILERFDLTVISRYFPSSNRSYRPIYCGCDAANCGVPHWGRNFGISVCFNFECAACALLRRAADDILECFRISPSTCLAQRARAARFSAA